MRRLKRAAVARGLQLVGLALFGTRVTLAAVTPGGDTILGISTGHFSYVGNNSAGTLSIDGGSEFANSNGYLGFNAGATGTATVIGIGSRWGNSAFFVGQFGSGTLNILTGGEVSDGGATIANMPGSTGNALVSGTGSVWNSGQMIIGGSGTGTLNIEAGARLSSGSAAFAFDDRIGDAVNAVGTVTVKGVGSIWKDGYTLTIGNLGTGTLNILNGGFVDSHSSRIGSQNGSGGAATVSGAGSKWTNDTLNLRNSSTLLVDAGGQVSGAAGSIDAGSVTSAVATVRGAGSSWENTSDFNVGNTGSGVLFVEAGGHVGSYNSRIGSVAGSVGKVTVTGTGSTLNIAGELYVGRLGQGTLTVLDGGLVTANTLYASPADLKGNGNITVGGGAILDTDVVFDAAHGTVQSLSIGSGGSLNLNANGLGSWGAGHKGTGSLRIADGIALKALSASAGHGPGSNGTVTVSGTNSKWTATYDVNIGDAGNGTLNVQAGGLVSGVLGRVGYQTGAIGTARVTGAGSKWTSSSDFYVGHFGSGTLSIEAGGLVSNSEGYVAWTEGQTGVISVTGTGSKWASTSDLSIGFRGIGTMTIEAGAQVTSSIGYLGENDRASGTVTVKGAGSRWNNTSSLYVGNYGHGTLNILNGGLVTNSTAQISAMGNSTSVATVSGAGSTWTNNSELAVGLRGHGTLTISNGGLANSLTGSLGSAATSSFGEAWVKGAGSKWINGLILSVGKNGSGSLTIADGGKVTSREVNINSKSAVQLHVSGNDMLVLGNAVTNGVMTHNGVITFYAGSSLAAGTYRPISEFAGRSMTWSGVGTYRAIGGVWDDNTKTFAVGPSTLLPTGDSDQVSSGERLLITDSATGKRVGVSFGTVAAGTQFSATAMGDGQMSGLLALLAPDQQVLGAWDFATNFSNGEVLLSYEIGLGAVTPSVWHFQAETWSPYIPSTLSYDSNGFASFTVTSFSGYAVTSAVPEPSTLSLMALGLLSLRRRRQKS